MFTTKENERIWVDESKATSQELKSVPSDTNVDFYQRTCATLRQENDALKAEVASLYRGKEELNALIFTVLEPKVSRLEEEVDRLKKSTIRVSPQEKKLFSEIRGQLPLSDTRNPIAALLNFCKHTLLFEVDFRQNSNMNGSNYQVSILFPGEAALSCTRESSKLKSAKEAAAIAALDRLNDDDSDPLYNNLLKIMRSKILSKKGIQEDRSDFLEEKSSSPSAPESLPSVRNSFPENRNTPGRVDLAEAPGANGINNNYVYTSSYTPSYTPRLFSGALPDLSSLLRPVPELPSANPNAPGVSSGAPLPDLSSLLRPVPEFPRSTPPRF